METTCAKALRGHLPRTGGGHCGRAVGNEAGRWMGRARLTGCEGPGKGGGSCLMAGGSTEGLQGGEVS